MKTRLLKIGIALLVSGSAIFVISASVIELGHVFSGSDDMFLPQNLAWINIISVFVGIPILLVGVACIIGSFVTKFPSAYVVTLSSIVFVSAWILFILSRFS